GLAEDLDEGADAVLGLRRDEAVGGRAALALGHALETLDAQDLGGLGLVAVGLLERLLDVEHAGAGLLTQRLDVRGGEVRHIPLLRCRMRLVEVTSAVRRCCARRWRRWSRPDSAAAPRRRHLAARSPPRLARRPRPPPRRRCPAP